MFKNVKKEEITIPAQMSYLIQVRDFIDRIGKKYKFHDKVVNSFKLVIDEACTNIIRHGYRDIKNGEITIKAIIRRLGLTMLIVDQGTSYDPRQANTPDLAKYIDIGKRGGLGILMMRKLMDDIQYSATERGNEFRLTKQRETLHESKAKQYWNDLNLRAKYSLVASIIFTLLSILIFTPLFISINNDTKEEVFAVSSSSCRSLADNVMENMLKDENFLLFEKSHSLKNNYENIIKEVFVVSPDNRVEARSNTSISSSLGVYQLPESAIIIDTLDNVSIYSYSLDDTTDIFDLTTEVLLGEEILLGRIHIWVDQQTIIDLTNEKRVGLIFFLIGILILGYSGAFLLIHKILLPFHNLAEWVRQVVHGKVDQDEIDIDASDELGEIAQAFDEMTSKFRKAQVTLVEQEKLQKELQVAQEIQQMLLPSDFPKVEGYEIASYYEAAKEVGGDLFDFVEVDDDTIGICVADVSGKGVPGSLIMTMIRTALRLESRGNNNPADVLAKVNRFVVDDMRRGMFVTMFYIILDSRNRIIHYASAGHNPMLLYRGSSKQTYYLNPSGFPVGIQLPDIELFTQKIETDSIRLREDDILVLYTDGITEAMNPKRELYHEERFLDSIRNNSRLDVGEFTKSINRNLKGFTGGAPQNDDITFVAVKEKLMSSEVIYRIQKELMNLISNGIRVKDALDQLRVSRYHYYKYKGIIDRKGLDGLKEYLEDQDYIEKKHLSIEVKTKIFEIIRKHPRYGAKRIALELNTDEYGNIEISPGRLYNELLELRLNTRELRERYFIKGGRKRIKQPGTPLLTLDGKVILDFESSEKEIASRTRGKELSLQEQFKPAQEPEKEVITKFTKFGGIEDTERDQSKAPATLIHKPAKPFQPEAEVKQVEPEEKERAETKKSQIKTAATRRKKIAKSDVKEKEQQRRKEEVKAKEPKEAPSKEELLKKVTTKIDQEKVNKFYNLVQDDIKAIDTLIKGIDSSSAIEQDIKKINLILIIVLKHPILEELNDVKRVFEQAQQIFAFIYEHYKRLDQNFVVVNVKELLNYLKKDNKFKDYNKLFETINAIGLIQHRINEKVIHKELKQTDEISRIRKKLAQKNIITKKSLLESMIEESEN